MPREPVLVLGDSHAAVFRHPRFARDHPDVDWRIVLVHGATASGLENPNDSRTRAYPTFRRALDEGRERRVVVTLGEVDTGFVIWYRAFKYNEPLFAMLGRAVDAYARFLSEASARADVLCLGAPLPTIRDGAAWGEVANLRREVRAPQLARTALTLEFNRRVRVFCRSRGISFLDLDAVSLGPDGLVRPELLNTNPADHHYEPGPYADLVSPRMTGFLGRATRAAQEAPPA